MAGSCCKESTRQAGKTGAACRIADAKATQARNETADHHKSSHRRPRVVVLLTCSNGMDLDPPSRLPSRAPLCSRATASGCDCFAVNRLTLKLDHALRLASRYQ